MKTTLLTLSLLPLALAQQNNGVGCDGISDAVANYACGLSAEGFNGAAATYLAQQLTASGIEDAFDAANSAAGSAAAFPTDASGQVNPLAIISALQPGATGVVSSILQQVASLQGGGSAAPAATGASGSGSGSAKATGSGSATTTAAKSSGSGSGAASGTGAMTTGTGGAASSSGAGVGAAGANATMSTHNAAAKPTMALGAVAGVLVGVAGLAAAL